MLLVKWQPQAREALWAILDYLSDRNHYAAETLYKTVEEITEAHFPSIPTYIAQGVSVVPV